MHRILIILCFLTIYDVVAIDVISHRGSTCGAVENTVAAVNNAWLAEADGVELDLRVSKDGAVFLFHDEKINDRPVSAMKFAEIKESVKFSVPTLEEVLSIGEPPGYFVLDLKDSDPGKYESLASIISASGIKPSEFVVQSSSVATLVEVKKHMPEASYYYLTHLKRVFPFYRAPKPKHVIAKIDDLEIDGVSLKGRKFINQRFIKDIKDAGYFVNVWTINDSTRASYYRDIGVDGVITDTVANIRSESVNGEKLEGQCNKEKQNAS